MVVAGGAAVLGACAVAPNQPGSSSLRIGVASCADQDKPQPIWDAALQQRCGFFVFAGDNVYASEPAFELTKLRKAQCVVEGHGWERWGNLPAERERLYRMIRDTQARGVVIVSGDRHIGGLYKESNATLPYALHEMTSSGVTHPWASAKENGPNRIDPLITVQHYGVIDIDFGARQLTLSLRGVDNRTLHSHAIAFEALRIAGST